MLHIKFAICPCFCSAIYPSSLVCRSAVLCLTIKPSVLLCVFGISFELPPYSQNNIRIATSNRKTARLVRLRVQDNRLPVLSKMDISPAGYLGGQNEQAGARGKVSGQHGTPICFFRRWSVPGRRAWLIQCSDCTEHLNRSRGK